MNSFRKTLAVVAVIALVIPGWAQENKAPKRDGLLDLNQQWSGGKAEGKGAVRFTHSPMRLEDIGTITPLGMMVGSHVMPIDHQYYYPKNRDANCDVFAPAAGHLVMIGHRVQLTGSSAKKRDYDDYALHIEHSSTFYTFYDLLTELDPVILKQLDEPVLKRFSKKEQGPPIHVRIPVKAGQVVGKVSGRSLDISVINTETQLKGFLTPALYGHYAWRMHAVDPFVYFDEPLKSKLLKLNPRKAEPRGGKIDYDVDGRAIGNWFKEGTGGYAGNKDKRGYWMGHLALAYNHIDPTIIVVSIGDFGGQPRQFVVKGNGPDPAKLSAKDEPMQYELLFSPFNGSGDKIELPERMRGVQGLLMVQVIEGRRLKVEVFPGKTANDAKSFTKAAVIYER